MDRLKHAIRRLRRNRAFALAVTASLMLGIGANVAIFTLADAVLFRPIPVHDPSHLIRIASDTGMSGTPGPIPQPVAELIGHEDAFDGLCGFLTPLVTVRLHDRISQIGAHAMTGGCFRTLGVGTVMGRPLTDADDRPGAERVVVLAHDTWRETFGSDSSILGKTIEIDGSMSTIVGVAEPGFQGLMIGYPEQPFFPFSQQQAADAAAMPVSALPLDVFARLRPGVAIEPARARLAAAWPTLLNATVSPRFGPLQRDRYLKRKLIVADASAGVDYSLRSRFRTPLFALLAISFTVLLVTSVNVANLLLAQAAERRGELAVRVALGASRSSLVYDVLTESILLLAGGAGGAVVLAYWTDRMLVSVFTASSPTFGLDVGPHGPMFSFLAAVSVIAFGLFAVMPAIAVSRTDPSSLQLVSSRVLGSRDRLRHATVVVQVALTIVLVAIGAAFINQLRALRSQPLGVKLDTVISAQLAPQPHGYDAPFAPGVYFRGLAESVSAIPGVAAVGFSRPRMLSGFPFLVGAAAAGSDAEAQVERWDVSDGFFSTVGIPIVAGAAFDRSGRPNDARRAAIVSRSAALALFGSTSIVGQHLRLGINPQFQSLEVVGIAADAVVSSPQQRITKVVYLNYWQWGLLMQGWPDLLVRSDLGAQQATAAVRSTVERAGHEFVARAWSLPEQRDDALSQERLLAFLSSMFGALGLALVIVGLSGLLAYSVAQRRGEIAIRMALGADAGQVRRLVVRDAVILVATGIAGGLPLAWLANGAAMKALYGHPTSPVLPVFASIVAMMLVGGLASWWPAARASSTDPLVALRRD